METFIWQNWLAEYFNNNDYEILPINGDASARKYYKICLNNKTYMFMDSSKEKIQAQLFILISNFMDKHSLDNPKIFTSNLTEGWILLEYFGDNQFFDIYTDNIEKSNSAYIKAIEWLVKAGNISSEMLVDYNFYKLKTEMDLTLQWYLPSVNFELSNSFLSIWQDLQNKIIANIKTQPRCFTHRDFHSKNIMIKDDLNLGIIDFQDAVNGYLLYDCVSILKDCYIELYDKNQNKYLKIFYNKYLEKSTSNIDYLTFEKWFDIIGLQRHLKCIGIFTRLANRDKKHSYLTHIPLCLKYIQEVLKKYPEFHEFNEIWQKINNFN